MKKSIQVRKSHHHLSLFLDNGNSSSDDASSRMVPTSSTDGSSPQQNSVSSLELQVAPMSNDISSKHSTSQRLFPLVESVKNILNQV
jgi:hypothetical protein